MSKTIQVEDGDTIIYDYPTHRVTAVAFAGWSDGTIHPASDRKRVYWLERTGCERQLFHELSDVPPFRPPTEEEMDRARLSHLDFLLKHGKPKFFTINKDDIKL